MRIGLISDTLVPSVVKQPPSQIVHAFAGVDLILHAGDITGVECLDWLERIAPVVAIELGPAAILSDPRVTERRVVDVEGYAIGLTYDLMIPGTGFQPTPGLIAAKFPPERSLPAALQLLFGRPVDIVVSGHTSRSMVEEHQGILFINPGSPSFPNQTVKLGTVGILEITPAGREPRIVNLADFPE